MHGGQFATQFCCGDRDCEAVQPGDLTFGATPSRKLRTRDSTSNNTTTANNTSAASIMANATPATPVGTATALLKNETQTKSSVVGPLAMKREPQSAKQRRDTRSNWCADNSLTSLFTCVDYAWSPAVTCNNVQTIQKYTKADVQKQVTNAANCDSTSACSITHGASLKTTTSLTNQRKVTDSQSNSIGVTLEAGLDIEGLLNLGGSVSYEYAWAHEIVKMSATANATAVQQSNSWSYSQVPGTYGFVWFTGTYNCELMAMECNGRSVECEKCMPAMLQGTQEPEGDVGFLTIGQ